MTRIIDASGRVLIEQLQYVPGPGEKVEVDGKTYVIASEPPVTRQVDTGMGIQFMRVVTAKPAGEAQSSGRRGSVVEG